MFKIQESIGEFDYISNTSKVEVKLVHIRDLNTTFIEPVFDLLPSETAWIDNLFGITRKYNPSICFRQPENKGNLYVCKILYFVTDNKIVTESIHLLIHVLDGLPAQVNLIPLPLFVQPALIVFRYCVDVLSLIEEVWCPLFTKVQIFLVSQKRDRKTPGLFFDNLENFTKNKCMLISSMIVVKCYVLNKIIKPGISGFSFQNSFNFTYELKILESEKVILQFM